jgi:CBS domain-containing protein
LLFSPQEGFAMTQTKEAMTKTVLTVRWNDSMEKAHELMEERRIRHLPVLDKEGLLVGVISDRDVSRAMIPKTNRFSPSCLVGDYMSWPALTVDENAKIADIAEGMIDEKISAFLVIRGTNEVVGIITSEDLLRLLTNLLKKSESNQWTEFSYSPLVRETMKSLSDLGI